MKNLLIISGLFLLNVNAMGQFNVNDDSRNITQQSRQLNNRGHVSRNINPSPIHTANSRNLIQNFRNVQTNKNIEKAENNPTRSVSQSLNRNTAANITNNKGNRGNILEVNNNEKQIQTRNIQAVNTNRNVNPVQNQNNSSVDQRNYEMNENNLDLSNIQINIDNGNSFDLQISNLDVKLEIPPIQIQSQLKINSVVPKLALTFPDISVENNKIKTEKIKEEKIKIEEAVSVASKVEKRKGGSSYSQAKNKNYTGKKIKIWFRKNFKSVKKIRLSVSCPKF